MKHIWHEATKQVKKEEKVKKLLDEMMDIYANARKGEITKVEGDQFFDCVDEAFQIISSEAEPSKELKSMKREIWQMSRQISFALTLRTSGTSEGEDVDRLAVLRQKGIISETEFQAFSERYKIPTGKKAIGLIKAISELNEQYQKGAMTQGNFNEAMWSLLDKLDRKI